MSKIKILTLLVVSLFLLNFGLILFFVVYNDNQKQKSPKEIIIEKLHFNKQQIVIYEAEINIHRSKIRLAENNIRNTKNKLYRLLNEQKNTSFKKDSLINLISKYQNQIEFINFDHYLVIKNICNEKQKQNFGTLTKDLARIFSKKRAAPDSR